VPHVLVAVLLAALIALVFRPWLRPFEQPRRGGPGLPFRAGDLTPLYSVWTQVAARSIFTHGELPLWSDHIYCGEPFFAKPQIGVLSLTTLLCGLLPAQVVATWTFLLHLWIAGITTYAWNLYVLRPAGETSVDLANSSHWCAAACGAIAFMLCGLMAEHTMMGHGPIVLVACWTPLVLRHLAAAFEGGRPTWHAVWAGVLVAVQLLAGGETVFLYNVIAGAVLSAAWILGRSGLGTGGWKLSASESVLPPSARQRARRVLAVGLLTGTIGFALAAVKILPGLELMPISNRAGGLLLEDAAAPIVEFREPAVWRAIMFGAGELADLRTLFLATAALTLIGCVAGLRRGRAWLAVAAVLLVLAGLTIAHSRGVFAVLWQWLPMFRYQRIPQRALVLAYLGVATLVAMGAAKLLERRSVRWRWPAGLGLTAIIAAESYIALPALPPTADIRAEVRDNAILNHLAGQPGLFRIHAVESIDRNWGIEHVTVPLGLSNLAGWDHLWLLEYLGAEGVEGRDVRPFLSASYESRHPARFWGMMNVRFVTSTREVQVADLRLLERFPACANCQPAKSAGPFLYENTAALPRAWVVSRATFVSGNRAARLEAAYRRMDAPDFDPSDEVVILSDRTTQSTSAAPVDNRRSVVVPQIERRGINSMRLVLSGESGYLVLAEKFAHFPGWRVQTANGPRPLLKANGVATAVPLDGTEQWIELSYLPRPFVVGAGLSLIAALLTACGLCWFVWARPR
jgi:hypothetical protein